MVRAELSKVEGLPAGAYIGPVAGAPLEAVAELVRLAEAGCEAGLGWV